MFGTETNYTYMTPTDPKVVDLLQSLPLTIHESMMSEGRIIRRELQGSAYISWSHDVESFEGTLAEGVPSPRFQIVASVDILVSGEDLPSRSCEDSQWNVATLQEPSPEQVESLQSLLDKDKRRLKLLTQGDWGYWSKPVWLGEMELSYDGTPIGSSKVKVSISDGAS